MASPILRNSPAQCLSRQHLFSPRIHSLISPHLALPALPFRRIALICSARRRTPQDRPASPSPPGNKKNKKQSKKGNGVSNDELDEDPFEALFRQLEEDLKNDQSVDDSDDDFTEEDLAQLEKELHEVLAEDEDLSDVLNPPVSETEGGAVLTSVDNEEIVEEDIEEEEEDEEEEEEEDEDDEEEEEPPVELKRWQLRQIAYALKKGRRKVCIKNLAAEVCLDRAVVLELLREPPPDLLLMSAALPDEPEPKISVPSNEIKDSLIAEPVHLVPSEEVAPVSAKSETDTKTPIHVMQRGWSAKKRFKKVHVETLERVYRRSPRPTNAIVSSIVLVTNLPRKRIVKWFEEKRAADGVPEKRLPYQRAASEPAFVRFSNIRSEADSS